MANFDVQIQALAGTAAQTEMDDWATDGVKEIITVLPPELKIECATITSLTSSTPMDLDATGQVFHATRENADSGYHIGCRKVNPILAGSADDATSIHYVTATDPIYWIESDTGGDPKLFVKPTPTANQPARVHHVAFPTVDVSAVSAIVNFPNEAEYLVVLYAAIKVLQNKMNEKDSNTDINNALSAVTAELGETQAVCDKIDADLVLAKAEVVLAKAEAAELATQTDNGGDFETACDAMATELNKVDEIIILASTEFDKVDNVIVEGSVELDKSTDLLDLGEADSEGAVNTAITLLITAVAQAASAADKFTSATSDSQFDTNATWDETNSQLIRVKDAVDKVSLLIESNKPASGYDAHDLLQDEDTELLQGNLNIVSAEINRAQIHIQEWVSIGDMRVKAVQAALNEADGQTKKIQIYLQQAQAKREESKSRLAAGGAYIQESQAIIAQGNAYIAEAQAYIGQAQGYASEVGARAGFSSAKTQAIQGYINTAQAYVATAQGFGNEIQSKIGISQGYIAEAGTRLQVDDKRYQWYQAQQTKLQQDYDKGVQMLIASSMPIPKKEEARR